MKITELNNILNIFHNNHKFIYDKLEKTVSDISLNINQPCFQYNTNNFIDSILIKMNISDKDIKNIINEFISNLKKKYGKILIFSDTRTFFLLLLIIYFINLNDIKNALRSNFVLLVKHYSILLRKSLPKGCNSDYFIQAKSYLSKTHSFSKNNLLNFLLILNDQLIKKYKIYLTVNNFDHDKIVLFIYEGRHRINQSLKSFISAYLKSYKNKVKSVSDENNYILNNIKDNSKIEVVNKVVDKIQNIEKVNEDSVLLINKLTRINKNILRLFFSKLMYVKRDNIENIYFYLLKDINDINLIKNRQFILLHTRKLMSVKVTKKDLYFKKFIYEISIDIFNFDLKLKNFYENVNNNTKYNLFLSVALYLADILHLTFI